jgi:hypothetical protein
VGGRQCCTGQASQDQTGEQSLFHELISSFENKIPKATMRRRFYPSRRTLPQTAADFSLQQIIVLALFGTTVQHKNNIRFAQIF